MATILCCLCGVSVQPSASNMCNKCLSTQVDITEEIGLSSELSRCSGCLRYKGISTWLECEFESQELMALCLKSVSGLSKVKLIDAKFIWTEPHSKRIKPCVIIFVVRNLKCPECDKQYHNNMWRTQVQFRQKAEYQRTLFHSEQLILQHKASTAAVGIDQVKGGMDFFFPDKGSAEKFVQFLGSHTPSRIKSSSKLISTDNHNNTANIKYTCTVEVAPPCKFDLVVLSKKMTSSIGGGSKLQVVSRITSQIHLIDPVSGKCSEVTGAKYWRDPFPVALTNRRAVDFVILDIEETAGRESALSKYKMVDVEVARASDFGVNDVRFRVFTHLGNILHVGDTVKGYDLTTTSFGGQVSHLLEGLNVPDIVLIKRIPPSTKKKENIKLPRLEKRERRSVKKAELAQEETEYNEFVQEYIEDLEDNDDVAATSAAVAEH